MIVGQSEGLPPSSSLRSRLPPRISAPSFRSLTGCKLEATSLRHLTSLRKCSFGSEFGGYLSLLNLSGQFVSGSLTGTPQHREALRQQTSFGFLNIRNSRARASLVHNTEFHSRQSLPCRARGLPPLESATKMFTLPIDPTMVRTLLAHFSQRILTRFVGDHRCHALTTWPTDGDHFRDR